MQPTKVAANAAKFLFDELDEFEPKKFISEAGHQVDFFSSPKLGAKPKEIAGGELKRARQAQKVEEMQEADKQESKQMAKEIMAKYREFTQAARQEQSAQKQEIAQLTEEVVKLAQASGMETKAHLQNQRIKVGKIDIKLLTTIIKTLRVKAEQSKSAKDLVSERTNAKRTTGMLAWVNGKQMKIHEQGTMTLQG